MTEENEVKTRQITIDELTTREIMSYYRIHNHDELVRHMRSLGIEHND